MLRKTFITLTAVAALGVASTAVVMAAAMVLREAAGTVAVLDP